MPEPYAMDFLDDVGLELLIIGKCAPLVDTSQSASAVYDAVNNQMNVSVNISETLGMTLPQAVDKLGIRPLAFGSAWKCLDILMEYALDADGLAPAKGRRWTISEKVSFARAQRGRARPLSQSPEIWERLTLVYAAFEEARHSLIHRRATTDATGALVGTATSGASLPVVSVAEQEALLRIVQLVAEAIARGSIGTRDRGALLAELDELSAWSGRPATGVVSVRQQPTLIEVAVTP